MITLSQRREVGEFRKRYRWMALFVVLVFGGIIIRVAQVQLFQRDRWSGIAQQNITKTLELPATRGVIRDIAGRVIASNRPSYDVYTTPRLLQPNDVERRELCQVGFQGGKLLTVDVAVELELVGATARR